MRSCMLWELYWALAPMSHHQRFFKFPRRSSFYQNKYDLLVSAPFRSIHFPSESTNNNCVCSFEEEIPEDWDDWYQIHENKSTQALTAVTHFQTLKSRGQKRVRTRCRVLIPWPGTTAMFWRDLIKVQLFT